MPNSPEPSNELLATVPVNGSLWLWEIDKPHARALIAVTDTIWNGEEWWVKCRIVMQQIAKVDGAGEQYSNELDRFMEACIPVGGRVQDLTEQRTKEGQTDVA